MSGPSPANQSFAAEEGLVNSKGQRRVDPLLISSAVPIVKEEEEEGRIRMVPQDGKLAGRSRVGLGQGCMQVLEKRLA